jgi:predicted transcriptional regulator
VKGTGFITKSFALDQETIQKLMKMANESDRSVSAMVRVCINDKFENLSKIKQFQSDITTNQ